MKTIHKPCRQRGFTIIELMMAIMVGAMILVVLYSTVLSVVTADKEINIQLSTTRVGPVILDIMSRDLEGVYVPNTDETFFKGRDSGGQKTSRDSVQFVTTSDSILANDEEQYASYIEAGYVLAHSKNKGFHTLYRREQFYLDDDPLEGGKYIELYDFVKRLNIEYYDAEREQWLDEWEIEGVYREFNPPAADDNQDGDVQDDDDDGDNDNNNQNQPDNNQNNQNQNDIDPLQEAMDEIIFPLAIRITLEIGIPPVSDDFKADDVPLATFQTILTLPVGQTLELQTDDDADNNGGFQPGN